MDALTVICENLSTCALENNVALGECLVPLPLGSAAAVLSDQTSNGSLVQHVCWRPLRREKTHLKTPP